MRNQRPTPGPPSVILGLLLLILVYGSALAGGYGITALIYRITGPPSELLRQVFSGLTALALIAAVMGLTALWRMRRGQRPHENIHDVLTGALAQIARGNFDVFLDAKVTDMHHDLAEAINDMARGLGNLETMRQDFISNVSHEIQSPLTSISGFAGLLKKEDLPAEQRRRYAEIIEGESRRLSSLSENLLKLTTLDNSKLPLNRQDFRLDKQLENVALLLEPQWSAKNLTLEADLPLCLLCGDEDLLSQVWTNLLHNAIKFTPEGGQISMELKREGNTARVTIADTGIGIGPEDRIHIFERFYKADKARARSAGGNGLGLSLVKKIVDLHGGSIKVESTIGKGTTFEIFLPSLHCV